MFLGFSLFSPSSLESPSCKLSHIPARLSAEVLLFLHKKILRSSFFCTKRFWEQDLGCVSHHGICHKLNDSDSDIRVALNDALVH